MAQEGQAFPQVCSVTDGGTAELGQPTAVPCSDVFSVSLLFQVGVLSLSADVCHLHRYHEVSQMCPRLV